MQYGAQNDAIPNCVTGDPRGGGAFEPKPRAFITLAATASDNAAMEDGQTPASGLDAPGSTHAADEENPHPGDKPGQLGGSDGGGSDEYVTDLAPFLVEPRAHMVQDTVNKRCV